MKKKFLSLVLAAMMTIGCFAGLGAAVGQDTDFAALSVEDQYAAIMAAGSEADAQALFDTLDAEQQAALSAYAEAQAEASEPETYAVPAVNYTNVAPLVTVNKVSQPAKARLMSARSTARPIEKGKTADGLILNKTATPVEGSADDYKITLEAYTTGTVSTSETTKPTDIVLVLDQSGSMADPMGGYKYTAYRTGYSSNRNYHNDEYYQLRHNGGSGNLWHSLGKDQYVAVSVEQGKVFDAISGWDNRDYYDNQDSLYCKVSGEYKSVTVRREGHWFSDDEYTYTVDGKQILYTTNDNRVPEFGQYAPLYQAKNKYIYSYTKDGVKTTIEESLEDGSSPDTQFFKREYDSSAGEKRINALKAAVNKFATSVAEKAKGADKQLGTEDDVNHRIAVVGFASESGYGNNTELLSISGTNSGTVGIAYNSITKQNLKDVLQDMDKQAGQTMVTNAINALAANGATRTDLGMDMANRILKANPLGANEQRNRVVVVFTDGSPTDSNGFENNVANNAINKAKTIKDGNTTVYSIGIFSGADATQTGTKPTYDFSDDGWGDRNYTDSQMSEACNWFMQNLSSNNGTVQDPSYYLSASDADTLSTIFQKISNQISESNINLGSDTQIKDVVSKYFDMPKNTSAVSVKSYGCIGYSDGEPTWSETGTVLNNAVTLDTENNTVNVTGFDFNANYVTEKGRDETDPKKEGTFHGRKLVIEFTVTAKDGFVGGNNVPTNGTDSGVYDKDGKLVANFVVPEVNVSITSSVGTNDKVIYEGNSVNVKDLYDEVDTSGADSWKYDFVKISYAVKQGDAAVGNTVDPADCTDYTVTATFAPISDGEGAQGVANKMAGKSVDGTATVHVLKPTVTVNATDVWKYYGESYTPDGSNVNAFVFWTDAKHSNITAADATGDAPYTTKDIQIGYDWVGKIGTDIVPNHDTDVNLTYKVNGNDITDKVNGDKSYKVIAKTCTLTVNKSVAKTYSNNDSFIFNVVGKGNVPYNAQVVITGNGSATLTGLPVGNYTVTEDTTWSWRYKSDNSKATTTLSSAKDNDSVTITNKLDDNRWLGDETFVINKCEKSNEKSKITKVYESVMSFFGIV